MSFCKEAFKLDETPRKWTLDVLKYLHKNMGSRKTITKGDIFQDGLGMSPDSQRRSWARVASLDSCLVDKKKLILRHEGINKKTGRRASLYQISKKGP